MKQKNLHRSQDGDLETTFCDFILDRNILLQVSSVLFFLMHPREVVLNVLTPEFSSAEAVTDVAGSSPLRKQPRLLSHSRQAAGEQKLCECSMWP